MPKKLIEHKIRVHTIPQDLHQPLPDDREYLQETSDVYRMVVDSNLLWRIWMIDEFGQLWIEVDFENKKGEAEFHTLVIDEGTYKKYDCDPYEVEYESASE